MSFEYLYDINYDFTNKLKNRTLENSDVKDYNCGGAALLTYNAFIPYRDRTDHTDGVLELYEKGFNISEIEDIVLWLDVKQMVKEFNGKLRVVEENYEPAANERLIAYRIFIIIDYYEDIDDFDIDSDYHFKYRDYNSDTWFEKCGFVGETHPCCIDNWQSGIWEYDSDIVYLALTLT